MLRFATGRVALVSAALLLAASACSESRPGEADASAEPGATGSVATSAAAGSRVATIRGGDLVGLLGTDAEPLLLDVRSREEFSEGHIPGAVNIPYDELPDRLDELAGHRDEEIVVYCRTGRRAKIAEATLAGAGFANVRDLAGHMTEWKEARRPVTEAVPCC
jgi:rhodanese-related sulfurtransferase